MTDSGEPWRKFRMDDTLWEQFGDLVGQRKRSEVIRSFVEWQIANPGVALAPGEQVRHFLVDIHLGPDGRRAEIAELAGSGRDDGLRAEIAQAIASHFAGKPKRKGSK